MIINDSEGLILNINAYLDDIITGVCVREDIPRIEVPYQWCIIDEWFIFLSRTSTDIGALIDGAIWNTFESNFPGLKVASDEFMLLFDETFSINNTVCYWNMFGEFGTISSRLPKYLLPEIARDYKKGEISGRIKHYERLYSLHPELKDLISERYTADENGWAAYMNDYKIAYGSFMDNPISLQYMSFTPKSILKKSHDILLRKPGGRDTVTMRIDAERCTVSSPSSVNVDGREVNFGELLIVDITMSNYVTNKD